MFNKLKRNRDLQHTPAAMRHFGFSTYKSYFIGGVMALAIAMALAWLAVVLFNIGGVEFCSAKAETTIDNKNTDFPPYGLTVIYDDYLRTNELILNGIPDKEIFSFNKIDKYFHTTDKSKELARSFTTKDWIYAFAGTNRVILESKIEQDYDISPNRCEQFFCQQEVSDNYAFVLLNLGDKEKLNHYFNNKSFGFVEHGFPRFMENVKNGNIRIHKNYKNIVDVDRYQKQLDFIANMTANDWLLAYVANTFLQRYPDKALDYIGRIELYNNLKENTNKELIADFNEYLKEFDINNDGPRRSIYSLHHNFKNVLDVNWSEYESPPNKWTFLIGDFGLNKECPND